MINNIHIDNVQKWEKQGSLINYVTIWVCDRQTYTLRCSFILNVRDWIYKCSCFRGLFLKVVTSWLVLSTYLPKPISVDTAHYFTCFYQLRNFFGEEILNANERIKIILTSMFIELSFRIRFLKKNPRGPQGNNLLDKTLMAGT